MVVVVGSLVGMKKIVLEIDGGGSAG